VKRKRLEHHAMHDAEDRRGRTNSKRDDGNPGYAEYWRLAEMTESKAYVRK
jgi:hypothetical protein